MTARLVWAMLTARRGVAITVLVIAAVTVAAGAAGPIYLEAAMSAAREAEAAAAAPADRTIGLTWPVDHNGMTVSQRQSSRQGAPSIRGLTVVRGLQVGGLAAGAGTETEVWLAQRTGVCQHLNLVAGRCVSGASEVMVSARTAADLRVRVGEALTFRPLTAGAYGAEPVGGGDGLSVVGVYAPRDPRSSYWGAREFVTAGGDADATVREAAFATAETLAGMPYADGIETVDLVPAPELFADPARLRAAVAAAAETASASEGATATGIPALLNRVEADRRALTDGVVVALIPLVLLSWLVLYLAVASSAHRRRAESGLTGLRGVPAGSRWWLGVGEYLLPIALGAPLGLLGAYATVAGLVAWRLPEGGPLRFPPQALAFAAAAVLGAAAIGALAQWRSSAVPVAVLLRRVPARPAGRRGGVAEVLAVALAAGATYQVSTAGAGAGGVALLVPMLIAVALGLLGARLAAWAAVRSGRRALRRGALHRALAAILVARQPGQVRLLSMFVVLFGLLSFAVTAADVARTARGARATTELGAARVLDVRPVSPNRLLAAVRAADPTGRSAMAVLRLPGEDGPPTLAVDSPRLPAAAAWPVGAGMSAARAAALLRPAPPAPIRFAGTGMQLRVTVTGGRAAPARVVLRLQPEREDRVVEAVLAAGPGARTYAVPTPACRLRGCRLVDLVVHAPDRDFRGLTVTVSAIRQTGPAAAVVTLAQLADPKRWLVTGVPGPHTGRGGLRLAYTAGADLRASVLPAGTPRALPTLVTPVEPPAVPAREGRPRAAPVGQLRLVPRAGGTGALIDLEYAELAGLTSGMAREPQVWLAADAPAELPARLREQGLVVVADRSVDVAVARQERSGPALALAFYLFVAVAAVAVGVGGVAVVAATERSALAGQLGALRAQGLPAVATWRIAFGGHLTVTVLGAVVGCAAGALSWSVARGVVPMFADGAGAIYAPAWPRPVPVLAALGAALVVLVVAGAAAAVGLRRAVERGDG